MSPTRNTPDSGEESPFNRTAQHDAKRGAILSQAAKLFNSKGSRATTLLDIAQSLGLTKTSLYYYVKTKEELIYQCYMQTLTLQHEIMDDVEAAYDKPLDRLRGYFVRHFEQTFAAHRGQRPHTAALLEIASLKDAHRKEVEQTYIDLFKRLRAQLKLGQADGSIRKGETIATTRAIIGSLEWSFNWVRSYPETAPEEIAGQAWDVLLYGLHPGPRGYRPTRFNYSEESRASLVGFDREEQHRLKQEAFYKTGTWFFNKQGFNGTSLDEIAEKLNVTKGAFYYHIKNKEDLLYNCYTRSLQICEGIYKLADELDNDGLHQLEFACGQIFTAQNTGLGPLIRYSTITALPIERRREILRRTERANGRFGDFIRTGITDGSVRESVNPDIAQELLAGAINAAMDIELWRNVDNLAEAAQDYFSIFFNGLCARGKRSAAG